MLEAASIRDLREAKELRKGNISFGSTRTDRNLVSELSKDGSALFKPKERKVLEAISRLSNDSSSENIRFLLNVAKNLQYGVRNGSHLSNFLNNESSIRDKSQKQNTNWETVLKKAITQALEKNTTREKPVLIKEFEEIFPDKPAKAEDKQQPLVWLSVDPNIALEKKLIELKNKIVTSDEFVNSGDKKNKTEATKHLDYFIASSEISYGEKAKCLEALAHFVSDDYKINPQLADRKIQILSEIINDLVIKTPESSILTIKKMSQGQIGMCAAISTGAKSMAHEYKFAHVSNLLALLDSSPTVTLYDVTDPKKETKMERKKADVNYKEALAQGYRVIDAAITNYMLFADQMGNGLTKSGNYVPFDPEHYGLFHDSHLNLDMDAEHQPKYNVFRADIKIKEAIKGAKFKLNDLKDASMEIKVAEADVGMYLPACKEKVHNILTELASKYQSNTSEANLNALTNRLLDPGFLKREVDSEINELMNQIRLADNESEKVDLRKDIENLQRNKIILSEEGPVVQKRKLTNLITSALPDVPDAEVVIVIDNIHSEYKTTSGIIGKVDGLASKSTLKGRYALQRKLFDIAAFYRIRKEFELDVPERLEAEAKRLNVKADKDVVLKKLENKGEIFTRDALDKVFKDIKDINFYKSGNFRKGDDGWKSNTKLYGPMNQHKDFFKKVIQSLAGIEHEIKRDYKVLNEELEPQLDQLYARKGRATGDYWEGSEGSSGLDGDQYSRLKTQLTGDNHKVVTDPKEFVEATHDAKGGIISATHVNDDEFSAHAQYGYDAKEEDNTINPDTGKVERQLNYYNDNTWGQIEDDPEYSWVDDAGHLRTSDGNGSGGASGYLLDPTLTTGNPEQTFISGTGVHKPKYIGKAWAKKLDNAIGQEYSIFMDGVVKGDIGSAYEKAASLMDSVIDLTSEDIEKDLDAYIGRLLQGNMPEIEDMAKQLVVGLNNYVSSHIEGHKLNFTDEELGAVITLAIRSHSANIIKPEGINSLVEKITGELPEKVDSILKKKISNVAKNVKIAEAIEEMVFEEINRIAKPGITIYPEKPDMIDKVTDKLYDDLMGVIRGTKLNKVLFDTGIDIQKMLENRGIQTRSEFDALPDNHLLKFLLNKMVLKEYCKDDETSIALDDAKLLDDLKEVHEKIVTNRKESIKAFILNKKTIFMDKPLNTFEEIQKHPFGRIVINWIDEEFNPESDKQLMEIFNRLNQSKDDSLQEVLDKSKEENLGIRLEDPYYILQKLRSMNDKAQERFRNFVFSHVFNTYSDHKANQDVAEIIKEHKEWSKSEEASKLKPREIRKKLIDEIENYYTYRGDLNVVFRNMKMQLGEVELDKMVRKERQEALEKYDVRPTFPVLKAVSPEEIDKTVGGILDDLESLARDYHDIKTEIAENMDQNTEELQAELEELKTELKEDSKVFVKGFVRPRHQDDLMRLTNQWLKATSKNPDSPQSEALRSQILKKMQKDYVLNHPVELLTHVTKQLPRIANAGLIDETDHDIIETWKGMLMQGLQMAMRVDLEGEIRKYISDSQMPQVAQQLRANEFLSKIDSEEGMPIESDESLQFIMFALEDKTNNDSTLKYFIEQTGLTMHYAKFFLSDKFMEGNETIEIKPDQPVEMLNNLNALNKTYEKMHSVFEQFIEEIGDELDSKGKETFTVKEMNKKLQTRFFASLDKAFPERDEHTDMAISEYKQSIQELFQKVIEGAIPVDTNDGIGLLVDFHEQYYSQSDTYNDMGLQQALKNKDILELKLSGLDMINDLIPDHYDIKKKIAEKQQLLKDKIAEFEEVSKQLDPAMKSKLDSIMRNMEGNMGSFEPDRNTGPADNVDDSELREQQQQNLEDNAVESIELLTQSVGTNTPELIHQMMDLLINVENEVLDNMLIDQLIEPQNPAVQFYAAQILSQKGYFNALSQFAESCLTDDGQIDNEARENQTLVVSVKALIDGINFEDMSRVERSRMIKTLSKLFNATSADNEEIPVAKDMLQVFVNEMPNSGLYSQKMLFDAILNKEFDINTRFNAIQILGADDTVKYFNLFQEIITKPKKYAQSATDKLLLMSAASNSVANVLINNPGLECSTFIDKVLKLELDDLISEANEEKALPPEEIKDIVDMIVKNVETMLDHISPEEDIAA